MGVINRRIDPNRRMLRQHPYDVWRVLQCLQNRYLLLGEEEPFHTPEAIAKILYVNFDDLMPMDRDRVLRFKLDCALRCLAASCFVEEESITRKITMKGDPSWTLDMIREGQGRYRARENVFNISGWRRSSMMESTKASLDESWGLYIGRRGAVERYLRHYR